MANLGATDGQPGAIGALLAAERKRRGQTLEQAADALRIRQPYLEAIEADRIDDLPGRAYALGFVRAYAEHLGLDGEEVVRRFKAGAAGLDKKKELVFPAPVSEGRFPGRMALAISVAAAIVMYGVWHQMASRDRSVAEQVPPVPAQMVEVSKEGEKTEGEPAKDQAEAKPEGEAKPADPASVASAPVALPPTTPAAPQTPVAQPQPPAAASPVAASPAPAALPSASQPAPQPAPPAQPAAAPPASAAAPLGPGVYGAEGQVRVVMRATSESWIQVQDSRGSVVAMRILKPGESFRVPNMPGLTLYTGNAGGLDVTVDGRAAPALGAPGSVRRNISLDPEKLMAGG
jgi:cytoskeleton protein RodZ